MDPVGRGATLPRQEWLWAGRAATLLEEAEARLAPPPLGRLATSLILRPARVLPPALLPLYKGEDAAPLPEALPLGTGVLGVVRRPRGPVVLAQVARLATQLGALGEGVAAVGRPLVPLSPGSRRPLRTVSANS